MFDVFSLVITAITVVASIIGIFLGIIVLRKPHITFTLNKSETSLVNKDGQKENISILWTTIANKRKFYLGDTAKNITACVLYRAPSNDNSVGLNFSNCLPWLETLTSQTPIPEKLTSQSDILSAIELHLFKREETSIPQGRSTGLAVAYGIESINRLFLATKPSVEILLPWETKTQPDFTGCFLRLEIAGENVASTQSYGTFIMAKNWKEWSIPTSVETVDTGSLLTKALIRMGIGRKQRIIEVKT